MSFIIPNATARAIQNRMRLYAKETRTNLRNLDLALTGIIPDEAIPVLIKIADEQPVSQLEIVTMFITMQNEMSQQEIKQIVGGNINYQWLEGVTKQHRATYKPPVSVSKEKPITEPVSDQAPVPSVLAASRKVSRKEVQVDDDVDLSELTFSIVDGDLWVTYPNGKRVNLGRVVGRDGRSGGGGSSGTRSPYVTGVGYNDTTLTISFSNGDEEEIDITTGFATLPEADFPLSGTDRLILIQGGVSKSVTLNALKDWIGGLVPTNAVTVNGDPVTVNGEYVTVS